MKINLKFFQILLIVILFFSIKLKAQTNLIGSTVKIGHLEVAQNDIGTMNHDQAVNACADLGNGWRLPTKEELNILYQNRNKLKGLSRGLSYWTSSEGDKNYYWIGPFFLKGTNDGGAFVTDAFVECVRPVRDLVNVNSTAVTTRNQKLNAATLYGKTKKSNTKVPSGIIDGVSQQDLLNALFADDLKPSSQKLNNSKQSTSASEKKCTYCWKRQKQIRRFDLAKDIYVEDRGDAEMRPGSVLCKDRCGGSGRIVEGAFSSKSLRVCNTCKGSGWIKCNNCKGTSFVK
jgi:hypothetical protein